jgi:2-dehydropantoate 2-reductase
MTAVTTLASVPPRSLVLLTTKVTDNRVVADALAAAIERTPAAGSTILCVQNGLGGEAVVKRTLSEHRIDDVIVLRAITQFGAIFQEPGVVDYRVAGHTLIERGPGSDDIAAALTACGLEGRVSENIKEDVWRKLIFNCVINPVTSIIGSDVGTIADSRLDPIKRRIVDECLAVAHADGVGFTNDFVEDLARIFGPSRNIASMRQDLLKGKPTEIDFMNGAVADLGRRLGIDCPVNAALVALIKAMEARGPFVVR